MVPATSKIPKNNVSPTGENNFFFRLVYNKVWLCFLLSCGYVLFVIMSQPLIFGGDDIGFLRAVEGGHDVPYMSLLLVRFLGFLYQQINWQIPWYAIFLYGIHLISITLYFNILSSLSISRYCSISFTLLFLAYYSSFLTAVSYNDAAIMVGGMSLFSAILLVSKGSGGKLLYIFYGVLFSCSYLIRERSIEAVLVFSAPIVLYLFFIGKSRSKISKSVFFSSPVIVVVCANLLIVNFSTDANYKKFLEFNSFRGKFHGFDVQFERKYFDDVFLEKNNWSETDADALNYWFYIDESKFNKQTLSNVVSLPVSIEYIRSIFSEKAKLFYERYQVILPLLFFAFLAAIILSRNYRARLITSLYLTYLLAGMLYMAIFHRFPPRIGFPIILLCSVGIILLPLADSRAYHSSGQRWPRSLLRLFCCLFALVYGFSHVLPWLSDKRYGIIQGKEILQKTIEELRSFSPRSFFVGQGLSLNVNYMDPFTTYHSFYSKVTIIPGISPVWTIFTPLYYASINQVGAKSGRELLPVMLDNDRAFFILWNTVFRNFLVKFAEENLQSTCHLEPVRTLANGRTVYRLVSGDEKFPWMLFMPAIIRDNSFPWNEYFESISRNTPLILTR